MHARIRTAAKGITAGRSFGLPQYVRRQLRDLIGQVAIGATIGRHHAISQDDDVFGMAKSQAAPMGNRLLNGSNGCRLTQNRVDSAAIMAITTGEGLDNNET